MYLRTTGKSTAIAVIFAALAGTSTLLNASLQDVEVHSVTLSFADLNLGAEKDQQTLYQRLQQAAKNVCKTLEARNAVQIRESRECYDKAMNDAIDDIGNAGMLAMQKDK